MKTFNKDDLLWYDREFEIPKEWEGKNILINFGAVDWKCELFINRKRVGEHTGGYSSFYFDITEYAVIGKNNITVKVIDITDTSNSWGKYQPVGKQTITPNGIWYTPASGIWQTVWLEPVNKNYIKKLEINNDFDNKEIKINFKVGNDLKLNVEYSVEFNNKEQKSI
jgi:beta-galactosidase/beta-glucuronidase